MYAVANDRSYKSKLGPNRHQSHTVSTTSGPSLETPLYHSHGKLDYCALDITEFSRIIEVALIVPDKATS